jgi:uncharacterized membrane protein
VIFNREPTLILGLIRAIIVLVTVFGLDLTSEQVAAVYLVAEAFLSLLNRQKVTPVDG